jgi:hypothetical protein
MVPFFQEYDLASLDLERSSCQLISLNNLFAIAEQKYPGMRDFEAQVVKRLAYFDRAEQEEPPPLLQEVTWEIVKKYFSQQAKSLAKRWLV